MNLEPVRSIAIVRALPGLGDLLCAVPALRALRRRFPDAHVALVGLPQAAWFADRFSAEVDELLPFPGFPGIPEVALDPPRITRFLAGIQERSVDLALQMHGSGVSSNPFCALLGARRTGGFVLPGLPCPDPELFIPYPATVPEPRRNLALAAHLGAPVDDATLAFPIREADRAEAAAIAPPRPYALINPGATDPRRRWPAGHFAAVGDALSKRGLSVALLGTAADTPLAAAVTGLMRCPATDLTGRTSLGGLAALLEGSSVLVTNDTGTSHLAAAVGARSVVIFLSADPARWAPEDRSLHRALVAPVAPEDVWAEVEHLSMTDPPSVRAR